jgi:2-succinyl-5-enolpyruvyl-6-hydroxy-3-cyclohexene-1-carboxylate synthase
MALALAQRPEMRLHIRIDERSAGFFALGRSLASTRPVIVLVTSGTAAMELHAAVAEADLSHVALIVITADRPPELHGIGAPQTVRQRELFGPLVRRFEEPGVARYDVSASWRPLANRLWRSACESPRGPVHLNAAFIEPLVATAEQLPRGREAGEPWRVDTDTASGEFHDLLVGSRPLIVAGAGASENVLAQARTHGWPILGDATIRETTAYFDAILRDDELASLLRPEVIVRTGGILASKVLAQRLREWGARVSAVGDNTVPADPDHLIERFVNGPVRLVTTGADAASAYGQLWQRASDAASEVLAQFDDRSMQLSEQSVARLVVRVGGDTQTPLVVGSSMPVREVEWFAPPRRSAVFSNRGANGIDGVNSTVLGVGVGSSSIGLVGDVTFLHDVSALTDGLGSVGGSCALVVVDNGGGGIFSFLPQASEVDPDRFAALYSTPRGHDLVGIARGFSHHALSVETNGELEDAISQALGTTGLSVIVAIVAHHRDNVILHDELNSLIALSVREHLL